MTDNPTPTPLSRLLITLRKQADLSTWVLAQRSGIDRANIRRIESGAAVDVTVGTMHKLADALDVEVERFYEAHWETTGRPLPSLPTYFRTKYKHLDDGQIAEIERFVADLDAKDRNSDKRT